MTRKYHNHTTLTKPRHCEEEAQGTNNHMAARIQLSLLFLSEMVAKLEKTLRTALKTTTKHKIPTNNGGNEIMFELHNEPIR